MSYCFSGLTTCYHEDKCLFAGRQFITITNFLQFDLSSHQFKWFKVEEAGKLLCQTLANGINEYGAKGSTMIGVQEHPNFNLFVVLACH